MKPGESIEFTPEQEEQLILLVQEHIRAAVIFGALFTNEKGELEENEERSKLFHARLDEEDDFLQRVLAGDY